jgi:hypothetical protein
LVHFRGVPVLGWDAEPPLRPDLLPHYAASVWHASRYFGQSNPFDIAFFVPLGALYWLLGAVGLSVAFSEKLMLCAMFVGAAYSAYWCARTLRNAGPGHAELCGLFYALSPVLLLRLYVPVLSVELVYALTPALAAAWIHLMRSRGHQTVRAIALLALLEICMASGANNPAFWMAPHLFCFLISVGFLLSRKDRATLLIRCAEGLAVVAGVNAFWMLPFVHFAARDAAPLAAQSINAAYTAGVKADVAVNATLPFSFRLLTRSLTTAGDSYGPYWTYASILGIPLVGALYFFYPLLAVRALLSVGRRFATLLMGVVLIVALFLMKGESAPFAWALRLLYHLGPLSIAFRDAYDKMAPLAAFSLAYLAAEGVTTMFRNRRVVALRNAAAILVALVLVFPFWIGQMFQWRPGGPSLNAAPPAAALSFFRSLDGYPNRILFLPFSANPLLISTNWGFYGPNIYGEMTRAAMVTMPVSTLNDPGTNDFSNAMFATIERGETGLFLNYARRGGISAIVLAQDLTNGYYGGITTAECLKFIKSIPGVRLIKRQGAYSFWQLPFSDVPAAGAAYVENPIAYENIPVMDAIPAARRCGRQASMAYGLASDCTIRQAGAPGTPVELLSGPSLHWKKAAGGRIVGHLYDQSDRELAKTYVLSRESGIMTVDGRTVGDIANVITHPPAGSTLAVKAYTTTGKPSHIDLGQLTIRYQGAATCCYFDVPQQENAIEVRSTAPLMLFLPLRTVAGKNYVISARYTASKGDWRGAVIDGSIGPALAAFRGSGARSLAFTAQSSSAMLYLYAEPGTVSYPATFHVLGATIAPARVRTVSSIRIPATATGAQTGGAPVAVSVDKSKGAAQQPVLEKNEQYDPMWYAHARIGGKTVQLEHITTDGFKNAWVIPHGVTGPIALSYEEDAPVLRGRIVSCVTVILLLGLLAVSEVRRKRAHA